MPEKADGSIIISAKVDDKRAQRQLDALEKKVKKLQNSIEDMQSKRSPLVEQMQAYGSELDKAKAKLAELKYMQEQDAEVLSGKTPIGDGSEFMRAKARQSALAADIERQEKEVAKLEKTWADVSKQVGFYDEKIKSAQVEIERASEGAAEIVERTNASAQATENHGEKPLEKGREWVFAYSETHQGRCGVGVSLFRSLQRLQRAVLLSWQDDKDEREARRQPCAHQGEPFDGVPADI